MVEKGLKSIRSSLERVAKRQIKDDSARKAFIDGVLSRISGSTNMQDAVRRADLVIEAVVENLEVKQKLFASIDKVSVATLKTTSLTFHLTDRSALDHFRQQHVVSVHCCDCEGYSASRPLLRASLLQPRAGHEAAGGHQNGRDKSGDLRHRDGVRKESWQDLRHVPRHSRVHRQPTARPVHQRGHQNARSKHFQFLIRRFSNPFDLSAVTHQPGTSTRP